MKYVLRVSLCFVAAFTTAVAQQGAESKPAQPEPSIRPTAEALMKAQSAADKAQDKREQPSIEELKKLIEREIAKSASLPVVTSVEEPIAQTIPPRPLPISGNGSNLVMIDGALYVKFGDTIIPMMGGGASGCFSSPAENAAKIERAKEKFADQNKSGKDKK